MAGRAGYGRAPAPTFSHRSTTPAHVQAVTCTAPPRLRAFRQTSGREILKPRTRWGFRPCARQIREAPWCRSHRFAGKGACSTEWPSPAGCAARSLPHLPRLAPATGQVLLDSRKATLARSVPPATHLHTADLQLRCNGLILQALRSQQHNARPACQPHARGVRARQSLQRLLFIRIQFDRRRYRITDSCLGNPNSDREDFVSLIMKHYTSVRPCGRASSAPEDRLPAAP